jgi:acyl-CoA synthetase (NDP forming)
MDGTAEAAARLFRLLRPRSVAVFGGKPAAAVIRQLRLIGYEGAIWPVHPQRDEIEGYPAYRSVAELPGAPDAAFIGVNRQLTIEIVEALARRGAGGAVVHAAGYAESGAEGAALQQRLIAAAGEMPFLGPNCYGFVNYLDAALLWPDQHGGRRLSRGVALVTQSGNIGLNLTMQQRGVPIAYVLTLGNQVSIDLPAAIEALLADERVSAIGLHIEGIGDRDDFARAALHARQRGVPILALKTGASETGAQLTISHTASLAGADAAIDAFFRSVGVVRVASLPVMLEALKLLHIAGPLAGRDIASMSCSGGEAALLADAVAERRLRFRPLTSAQQARVGATLGPLVTISNPLDYHTFSWANEPALTLTFTAMMAAAFDVTMLILDFPRLDRCDDADWLISARALEAAAARTGHRAAIVASLPEAMPEPHAERLAAAGIVPLCGIDEALAAIEAAADCGELRRAVPPALLPHAAGATAKATTLGELQGKRALAAHGLLVPEGHLVISIAAAEAAAIELGFPIVLKAAGAGLAHKTERGAVRLGLGDAEAVRRAAEDLIGMGDALLVERMVPDAVAELIIGVARDPAVGLYLVLGSGGIAAELLADRRALMLRAAREEVEAALRSLKLAPLLSGYRGRPKGDVAAAVDAVMAVQDFAAAHADRLIELDVNPLLVRPQGGGAVAVDVLIRLAGEESHV